MSKRTQPAAKAAFDWKKFSTVAYPAAFGLLLAALWQLGVLNWLIGADSFTLPAPDRIASIIGANLPDIGRNVLATLIVALGGLVVGSALGYLIAIVADGFPQFGVGGLTVVSAFNAVPIIAIAPIMNNLTKELSSDPNIRSMIAKTCVVTITCMVAMSVNAYRGFTELKPFALDYMRSIAAGRRTVFAKLKVPNSVPYIFIALRISVPGSIISAMVSEYFAEYIVGLGRQIRENIVLAQYATAWAYIAAAFVIGIGLYVLLLIAENALLRGRRRSET